MPGDGTKDSERGPAASFPGLKRGPEGSDPKAATGVGTLLEQECSVEVKAPLQREWGKRAVGRRKEEKGDTSCQRWGRVAGQEKRSPDMNSPIQG